MGPSLEVLRDRTRGCLLAGAVGDALGAAVEFDSLEDIRARFGPDGIRQPSAAYGRVGAITDDTQLTLFTAEGLVLAARAGALARPGELVRIVHRAHLRWLRTQGAASRHASFAGALREGWLLGVPALHARRAPGATVLAALASQRMGRVEHPLNTSKGCGGVMRIAPVGLALAVDDAFGLGCAVAALTHGHPSGQLPAGFQARLVRELLLGAPLARAVAEAQEELVRCPHHGETAAALEAALAAAAAGEASAARVEALGAGWVAEEALGIAVYCALAAPDLASGLLLAANHGGDSDSTAALTGNLLGARWGAGVIPPDWLATLELREEIEAIAETFLAALVAPDARRA